MVINLINFKLIKRLNDQKNKYSFLNQKSTFSDFFSKIDYLRLLSEIDYLSSTLIIISSFFNLALEFWLEFLISINIRINQV